MTSNCIPTRISDELLSAIYPGVPLESFRERGRESLAHLAARMIDQARGVHAFNWEESLVVVATSGALQITVRQLEGITPRGHAITLHDFPLTASLRIGPGDVAEFDLAVETNPPYAPTDSDENLEPLLKYQLHAAVNLSKTGGANLLSLGRYRWELTGGVQMIKRPPITRLVALQPFNQQWSEWIAPLLAKLSTISQDTERDDQEVSRQAKWLLHAWPALTVRELVMHLMVMTNWERPCDDPAALAKQYETPFPEGFPDTDCLPKTLAQLVDGLSTARGEKFELVEGEDFERITAGQSCHHAVRLLKALNAGDLILDYGEEATPSELMLRAQFEDSDLYHSIWLSASHVHHLPALPAGSLLRLLSLAPAVFPKFTFRNKKRSSGE